MHPIEDSPLGKRAPYPDEYDPALLYPVPRAPLRRELGIVGEWPFFGYDLWNAYELSWLNAKGKPQIALATFVVTADTPNIVESKSFKLYLNSYNQTRINTEADVRARLQRDLGEAFGGPVEVTLQSARSALDGAMGQWSGISVDDQDVDCDRYTPDADLLHSGGEQVQEVLCSDLLKSNCPITGQPDWASVQVDYLGPRIDRQGLLRYIVSYRRHGGFHEHCVERIFMDLLARCGPQRLTVYARYTRRGGLDINPLRSSEAIPRPLNQRLLRQ